MSLSKFFRVAMATCLSVLTILPMQAAYINAPYIVQSADQSLTRYRVLTGGNNLFNTDGGVKTTFTQQVFPHTSSSSTPVNLVGTSNTVQFMDATSGNAIVNLPAASSNTDKHYIIKKTDSSVNTVTVTPNGSDKIDGAATYVLSAQYATVEIQSDGTNWFECALITPGGGAGTVTSAGLADSTGIFNITGTPVTTTGTLTLSSLKSQSAHTFLGNNTGSSAAPNFVQPAFTDVSGSVAAGQMPALTGDVTSSAGAVATTLATVNSNVGSFTSANITVNAKGLITAAANGSGGSGTVTSVAMTGDGVIFNSAIAGSPVTTAGTLAPSLLTQTKNTLLAGPIVGSSANPTFRALSNTDMPVMYQATTSSSQVTYFNTSGGVVFTNMTLGPDGNIWYAMGGAGVEKISPSGILTTYTTTSNAQSVAVGPDGNIWYTTGTTKIGKISTSGTGDTEYTTTTSTSGGSIISGPDGNMWYTTGSSKKIGKISTSGTGNVEFSTTSNCNYLTVGADRNIWYSTGTGKIGKVTTSGTITEYTTTSNTSGVVAGPDGNIWYPTSVAKIGVISTSGTGDTEYTVSSFCNFITVGPDGNMWYTTGSLDKIGTISITGTGNVEYSTSPQNAESVVLGSDGNMWYATSTTKIGQLALVVNSKSLPATTANSVGNLSPLFTASITSQALSFALSSAAGNSWFGNSTGSTAAPAFHTTTLPPSLIPVPSATTLGGIESLASSTSRWINAISTSGVPSATQPAFTDISGTATVSQGGTGTTTLTGAVVGNGTSAFTAGTLSVPNGGTGATTLTGAVVGNGTGALTAGTLSVPNGGTGATTLAAHGLVVGNGTSAVNATGTGEASGEPMTSQGASADPQFLPGTTDNATKAFQFWAPQATNAITQTLSGTVPIAAITAIVGGTDTTGTGASGKIVNAVTTTSAASSAGWESSTFTVTEMQCGPIMAARVVTPAALTGSGAPGIWVALTSANEATTQSPTNSIVGFRFWGGSDTDWICYSAAGSTGTATDSTLAVVGSTVYDLVIDCSTSGHARFYINGVLKADVTATLPAAATTLGVETTVDNVTGTISAKCGFGVMRIETY